MDREEILKGAAGYIERFKGKIFVIKYGGSLLDDEKISDSILDDIVFLHNKGIRVVLVHGGGSEITRVMKKNGKEPRFINGLRATDRHSIEIVDKVLNGLNKRLVDKIKSKGDKAESVISKEKSAIIGKKRPGSPDGDFTGEIARVETGYIKEIINREAIPVVSPIALGEDKNLYNINADLAAAEVAAALKAEKLLILTDVKGVMAKRGDESSLISTLTKTKASHLIDTGVIDSGMIPKVQAGINSLDKGVKKAHIINGKEAHSLLIEVFTDKGAGTEIVV
jgi:acetylglutamate kinase